MKALIETKKECFKELGVDICCHTCGKKKNLLIHHQNYLKYSVVYRQFNNSEIGRLQYYAKLLDEIKISTNHLYILCFDCHTEFHNLVKLPIYEIANICHKTSLNKWYDKGLMEKLLFDFLETRRI